jgi:formyl-CoA transferase
VTNRQPVPEPSGPLNGVVVVDLSRALAGPHAAMMLGDLGARVIKVETPGTGDDTRGWGPPFVGPADAQESTYFLSCNRNKESIELDLKSDDGRQTLARLVRHADVLVENFRTGVLDRLGFPVERLHELNPRLVVLSITGFGHDGPEGGRAGYDQIAQGEAGLMSLTGPDPASPTRVGVPDRRPARRDVRRVRRRRGPDGARAHRARGRSCARRCWRPSSGCTPSRARGTRSRGRCRGRRATTTRRCRRTARSAAATRSCRSRSAARACGAASRRSSGIDPEDPRFARNRDRVEHREQLVALVDAAFADRAVDDVLAELERAGVPGRRGPDARPRVRLGPDPLAGAARRRRAQQPRARHAARPAAALRRGRGRCSTGRRRGSTSTPRGAGLAGRAGPPA